MIKIGFTGHRPDKLYGYDLTNEKYSVLKLLIKKIIMNKYYNKQGSIEGITGGALGFDTLMFDMLDELKTSTYDIKTTLAIPFKDQPIKWPEQSQIKYNRIKNKADEIVYVDTLDNYKIKNIKEEIYHKDKLFKRNEYIADNSNILIACIKNNRSGSGSCLKYFIEKYPDKDYIIINPETLEVIYKKGND